MARLILLAALMLLVFQTCAAAGEVTVAVSEQAEAGGRIIRLGDIAQITGGDDERIALLKSIEIGSAPLPGSAMTLTREVLGMRLAAAGKDLSGIAWEVPAQIVIKTPAQTVKGETLTVAAAQSITKQAACGDDIAVEPAGIVQDLLVPAGELRFNVELPGGIRYNTPTTAIVGIYVNDVLYTKATLRFNVKQYKTILVASRPIGAREMLTGENLRFEKMDVGRLPGYITDLAKVQNLVARRPIAAGAVLTLSMVDKPDVIKRGAAVNIVAQIGGIEVAALGTAMQNGSQGELIRVQNNSSRKIVWARVVDDSTVAVPTHGR